MEFVQVSAHHRAWALSFRAILVSSYTTDRQAWVSQCNQTPPPPACPHFQKCSLWFCFKEYVSSLKWLFLQTRYVYIIVQICIFGFDQFWQLTIFLRICCFRVWSSVDWECFLSLQFKAPTLFDWYRLGSLHGNHPRNGQRFFCGDVVVVCCRVSYSGRRCGGAWIHGHLGSDD